LSTPPVTTRKFYKISDRVVEVGQYSTVEDHESGVRRPRWARRADEVPPGAKAGLSVALERDRREFGVTFFRQLRAMIAETGPPTLGLHIVVGQDAATKVANMIDNLERASIAPIEMICHPV